MKKIISILVLVGFVNVLLGQVGLQVEESQLLKIGTKTNKFNFSNSLFSMKNNKTSFPDLESFFLEKKSFEQNTSYFFTKKNKTELAFFCDLEVKLEKSSKLPVRFRLGEVQAVDRKEGKWSQFNQ